MATTEGGLRRQSLSCLDPSQLNPLSPEVISRQATINFGTIGHVAHGKSTVVRAISGVQTVRFKREKERNITIKLGYANAKIFKCTNPECPAPDCYSSGGSRMEDEPPCGRPGCGSKMKLVRHVSFVDCPGHDILMATMLNGAAIMDAALLLVAGNEPCPQPQTSEHLAAVEIMRLKHIIILQNKIELIKENQALQQQEEIRKFVAGTAADSAPIIPISAVLKYNTDVLCEYICTQVPVPVRDFTSPAQMIVIRSFDVNKPGEEAISLRGGVAGGSILRGVIRLGDEIEIRPGVSHKAENGEFVVRPIRSRVVSLYAEQNDLKFAVPGGLIGVGTNIDPTLTRSDRMVGQVLGSPGHLPDVVGEVEVTFYLLRRILGVRTSGADASDDKTTKIGKIKKDEFLMINIGSNSVGGRVVKLTNENNTARLKLNSPVCAQSADKIAISRRVEKHWRLIGWGSIVKIKKVELQEPF